MEQSTADPRSIDAGRVLVALGAIALLVGLFGDWYSSGIAGPDDGVSAWTVFEIVDLLLGALALLALFAVAELLTTGARLFVVPTSVLAGAAFAALVLVAASLVNDPPAASGTSLEEGIWISFAGSLLMAVGVLLGHSRVSLVVTPREQRVSPPMDRETAAETETETQVLRRR